MPIGRWGRSRSAHGGDLSGVHERIYTASKLPGVTPKLSKQFLTYVIQPAFCCKPLCSKNQSIEFQKQKKIDFTRISLKSTKKSSKYITPILPRLSPKDRNRAQKKSIGGEESLTNDNVCDYVDQATRITSNKRQHPCHQITSDDFSSSRPSICLHTGVIKKTFLTQQVAVKCGLIVERK